MELLESLDAPAYKVASFEAVDLPLIACVARTGKPMIISTGMATVTEIAEAAECAMANGCTNLTLLKCTSSYPASPENTNLLTIPVIRDTFRCNVGLSDHTLGIGVAVAAVALGASVIEKHFIIDRSEGGVDSAFSLEPPEFTALVDETLRAWQALGHVHFGGTASETAGRKKAPVAVYRGGHEGGRCADACQSAPDQARIGPAAQALRGAAGPPRGA